MWTESEYEDAAYYRLLEARNYITEDSSRYRRPIVTTYIEKRSNCMIATCMKKDLVST